MKNTHTGVLLVNLGTPDSPSVPDVRKYLREFLMDRRVIDIPVISRFLLVNGIIAPFRSPKSAAIYRKLWTKEGSPLLIYGLKVKQLLQEALGNEYKVALGMRYQNPSVASALADLDKAGVNKIVVLPLFPQYASASTGSVIEAVMDLLKGRQVVPELTFINQFYKHPLFIEAFAALARPYLRENSYDQIVFTYHGLPERQITKADPAGGCLKEGCCNEVGVHNSCCYRAQCFETTRLLVAALGFKGGDYVTCFQSRLGSNPWIKPYTDEVTKELAASGKKRVLALVPSFIADCLETTIEVGEEYKELFLHHGGEKWEMVQSLNDREEWIACLKALVVGTK